MALAPDECTDDRPPEPDAPPPEPPGTFLREAREARGMSVDDVARATKINKSMLLALEASDVLRLPAAVYTRGFVKAYAAEVGLDPEKTAEEYLRRIEPLTTQHLLVDDGILPPLAEKGHGGFKAEDDSRELLAVNQVRRFSRLTTVAAAIGLVIYVVSFNRTADERQPTGALLPPSTDAAHATSQPVDGRAARGDIVPAALDGPLEIELISQGPCWVVATVDGDRVLARLLQPGERQTFAIAQEAVFRVGDPGVLSFSINGQTGRVLGPPGQPVNITITRDNFKNFLSS